MDTYLYFMQFKGNQYVKLLRYVITKNPKLSIILELFKTLKKMYYKKI